MIILESGKARVRCELKRHLSPRTVGAVMRALPIRANAHRLSEGVLYLETGIDSGIERPRRAFSRGEIAFLPAGGSICFFTRDAELGRAASPIGRMLDDAQEISGLGSGDLLEFYAETGR